MGEWADEATVPGNSDIERNVIQEICAAFPFLPLCASFLSRLNSICAMCSRTCPRGSKCQPQMCTYVHDESIRSFVGTHPGGGVGLALVGHVHVAHRVQGSSVEGVARFQEGGLDNKTRENNGGEKGKEKLRSKT